MFYLEARFKGVNLAIGGSFELLDILFRQVFSILSAFIEIFTINLLKCDLILCDHRVFSIEQSKTDGIFNLIVNTIQRFIIAYWYSQIQVLQYLQMGHFVFRSVIFALITLTGFLFFSDTPIGTQPTQLPQLELKQQLSQMNIDLDRLRNAQYIQLPKSTIEDVAVDRHGNLYVSAGNGPSNIYKISPHNTSIHEKIAETNGKVLGTALNREETLLALVDQSMGLRILNLQTKSIKTIVSEINGTKITAMNSVTFTDDPNILYFTKSCDLSMQQYHLEILYKTGTGKIYQLDLKTGRTKLFLDGLQFVNGITYSHKDNCLYANEIGLYRVIKVPLTRNSSEEPTYQVVADNLIGYPDNLKITEDGKLWVAIPSLRDKTSVFIDNHPAFRKALINARIPERIFLLFANLEYSGGLKIEPESGKVVDYLFGKSKMINFVTGIVERNKKVYMSSLKHNVIAVIDYI